MRYLVIGPTRVAPGVLEALAWPPLPINHPDFVALFRDTLGGVRRLVGATGGAAFVVPGTGTMGMEMVAASFLAPGLMVAVLSTGSWGDRWAEIAERVGLRVRRLACPPGEVVDSAAVGEQLRASGCRALFVTHVDSSTGVRADVAALAAEARAAGALTFVDGICAAGAEEVEQDAWGVDVYLASTPKALGVPAGLVLITASERAVAALRHSGTGAAAYALDLRRWLPAMAALERGRFEYFQSPAGNLVYALAEGLRLLHAEPLTARLERHETLARDLHCGLDGLGIEILVRDPERRARGVTVCLYPEGHGPSLLDAIRAHGVWLQEGTHPAVAERTFRIGHLGNVTADDIRATVDAVGRALAEGAAPRPSRTSTVAGMPRAGSVSL